MDRVQEQDIKDFASSFAFAEELTDSTFLITGATGLIGSTLIHCLLALEKGIRIVAPVRNKAKAISMFGEKAKEIELIECDLLNFNYSTIGTVDHIVHCAAPTASKYFVEHGVETFETIMGGTSILLKYAKTHAVKSLVFLSSLEVYGSICEDIHPVNENVQGYLDPMSVRSSYPMAKRAAENLCCLYANEYRVPVKVARLTQTTGAGIAKDDNRVIAQFARLAVEGKDIVLHTTGEAARPYCYTTDVVSAILYILLRGKSGEAYNVANENTYISARGMAEYLKENFNPNINVRIELKNNMGYAPSTKLRLSAEKLMGLGWKPNHDLKDIFDRLICYIRDCRLILLV